jgi:hypothetical protein
MASKNTNNKPLTEEELFEICDNLEVEHYDTLEEWCSVAISRQSAARKIRAKLLTDHPYNMDDKYRIGACLAAAFGL